VRFTGSVSSPPPPADPDPSDGAGRFLGRRARRPADVPPEAYWRGWPEVRADLRSSAGLVLAMALAGVPAGLVWWWLAPRADFRITDDGAVVIGDPSAELRVADDMVFVLVLGATGLLLGAAAWFLRRRRGVATVVALALGACLMSGVAWQLGELLGAGPTEAELADVGAVVTTPLVLASPPALAVAPFMALVAYVAAVLYAPRDDLGRTPLAMAAAQPPPDEPDIAYAEDRALVDVPPPGRPSLS
jgi:hypothetical protein